MKKLNLFLLAALLAAGCATSSQSPVEESTDEVTATPKWAAELDEAKAKHAEEKKKAEEEYAKQVTQQKSTPAPQKETKQDCKINGHDCWAVVQKLGQTKEVRTENPDKNNIWAPDIITYENPDLKTWRITVTQYTMFRDGGSTVHVLNENVSIRTNRSIGMRGTPAYGLTTIKFKETGNQFIYDSMGNFLGNESPFPN